ncbi:MAG: AAA family ATPase [Clostridiales Family XIII bacterium]|jgi:NadR type nicotinamide-nucleotide adenylyltransferase|nr:AAA family ATPase [Clostridiales Family XIII bacterium]
MSGKKTGLTLGKFAPFHKGHEWIVETMLAEMDEAVVIIYDSGLTPVPLPVRAGWIRTLYPQVRVLEAWDGPSRWSSEREHERLEEEYVKSLLGGVKVDAFYSSEHYGAHMSSALGCADRRVDEARERVPVSGTMLRGDPYRWRAYVSGAVYRDLIVKAVFVGAMSTGKSTITRALAERFHTTCADEYGREYWEKHQVGRRIGLSDFDSIAVGHIEREDAAIRGANRYFFVDTNAITTYMFALDYHGRAPGLLTRLALENATRYDLFFLCGDEMPYDDTWDRSGDAKRHVFQKQIIADLKTRKIPYIPLAGNLAERMAKVEAVLAKFSPFGNFYGLAGGSL